jgi:hypothetical protein
MITFFQINFPIPDGWRKTTPVVVISVLVNAVIWFTWALAIAAGIKVAV